MSLVSSKLIEVHQMESLSTAESNRPNEGMKNLLFVIAFCYGFEC